MNHDDERIEAMLRRYRPAGPPPELAQRVLKTVPAHPVRPHWRATAWWTAAAALLMLTVGLNWMADSLNRRTAIMLGVGQIRWTAEAQEAADMLNGDGQGRVYVALCLAAGAPAERSATGLGFGSMTGGLP